jgi:hypothetical protein
VRSNVDCTNLAAWSTTRALFALSPAVARETGFHSNALYPSNLTCIRIALSSNTAAPSHPVPDMILAKFSALEIVVPISLIHSSGGPRNRRQFVLVTLSFRLERQADESWRLCWCEWKDLSPKRIIKRHENDLHYLRVALRPHMCLQMESILEGEVFSQQLDVIRARLGWMMRGGGSNVPLMFPVGWQMECLDRAVEKLERWQDAETLRKAGMAVLRECWSFIALVVLVWAVNIFLIPKLP